MITPVQDQIPMFDFTGMPPYTKPGPNAPRGGIFVVMHDGQERFARYSYQTEAWGPAFATMQEVVDFPFEDVQPALGHTYSRWRELSMFERSELYRTSSTQGRIEAQEIQRKHEAEVEAFKQRREQVQTKYRGRKAQNLYAINCVNEPRWDGQPEWLGDSERVYLIQADTPKDALEMIISHSTSSYEVADLEHIELGTPGTLLALQGWVE